MSQQDYQPRNGYLFKIPPWTKEEADYYAWLGLYPERLNRMTRDYWRSRLCVTIPGVGYVTFFSEVQ